MSFLKDTKIGVRLIVLVTMFVVFMGGTLAYSLYILKSNMIESRKESLHEKTETAIEILKLEYQKYSDGILSEAEAQKEARERIRNLTYGNNEYFFLYTMEGVNLANRPDPSREGKLMLDVVDPNGVLVIKELATLSESEEGGFLYYSWDRQGQVQPKLSYARQFQEWKWFIGTGVYIDDIDRAFMSYVKMFFGGVCIALIFASLVVFMIIKSITKPLGAITQNMIDLSEGRIDIAIDYDQHKDEIGQLARALKIFHANMLEMDKLREQNERQKVLAEEDRKKQMLEIAQQFDDQVGGLVTSLASAATELQSTASNMKGIAAQTTTASQNVAHSSDDASANVNTVASAMEEMSATATEISQQVLTMKSKSNDTAKNAQDANDTVTNLNVLTDNIGIVVEAIRDIAEQTNLLALNATIEAARAGEAGKGFAVVAEEVKKLASETGRKTEEINERITEIQEVARASVAAMQRILGNISDIDMSVTGVSAAIEEQNATTSEIVRSISEVSMGVQRVSGIINDVRRGAEETGDSSETVLSASTEMAKLSETLNEAVRQFLHNIRSGNKAV